MNLRPKKSRPSNVIINVFLSLVALIGLFVLGQLFQSWGQESTDQSDRQSFILADGRSAIQ